MKIVHEVVVGLNTFPMKPNYLQALFPFCVRLYRPNGTAGNFFTF